MKILCIYSKDKKILINYQVKTYLCPWMINILKAYSNLSRLHMSTDIYIWICIFFLKALRKIIRNNQSVRATRNWASGYCCILTLLQMCVGVPVSQFGPVCVRVTVAVGVWERRLISSEESPLCACILLATRRSWSCKRFGRNRSRRVSRGLPSSVASLFALPCIKSFLKGKSEKKRYCFLSVRPIQFPFTEKICYIFHPLPLIGSFYITSLKK